MFAGGVSAQEMDDDVVEYTPDENQRPDDPLGDGKGLSYSQFSDQASDKTGVIVDDGNITTEEGVGLCPCTSRAEEGITDVVFLNEEDGSPQNAAATIIGYLEYLKPSVHQNIKVSLFQDEELDVVSDDLDRLRN